MIDNELMKKIFQENVFNGNLDQDQKTLIENFLVSLLSAEEGEPKELIRRLLENLKDSPDLCEKVVRSLQETYEFLNEMTTVGAGEKLRSNIEETLS